MIYILNCKLIINMSFNLFLFLWSLLAILIFITLFFVNAPYGRYIKNNWGFLIPAKAGWIIMESPSVFLMIFLTIIYFGNLDFISFIFIFLWLLHYTHRTLIYPFFANMNTKDMPISIAVSAFFFNIVNVSVQFFGIFILTSYETTWLFSFPFIIGIILFLMGMFINIKSDYLMILMKKELGPGYHIPNKFLYKFISSPNYFGEIIEWAGWAIMTMSTAGLTFLIWTIANLLPRAMNHHKWYMENFENYPKDRKAIIPKLL